MAKDWIKEAAEAIWADITDRRGLKWEARKVDKDVLFGQILPAWAEIIRSRVPVSEEWISVKDRMPERGQVVQAMDRKYTVPYTAKFTSYEMFSTLPGGWSMSDVHHWKPLGTVPPPPSAGKDEPR